MIWRLDLNLLAMLDHYGPVWPVVAVLCLLWICFGRLSQGFLVGMTVLLGSLVWYRPLSALAHVLRWWIFAVLAVRGMAYVVRSSGEREAVGRVPWSIVLLGCMAMASCLWARSFVFAFFMAGTFACTLLLCYVVAWRLMDTNDFLRRLCVGALVTALSMQGLGCVLGLVALFTSDYQLVAQTGVHGRFAGVMLNANGNGVFGAILWPIVLASPRDYLGKLSALRWPALLALAACIVFSGSRTAVGVALMTTFVYSLYRFRAGAVGTTALVGFAGAALLLTSPLEELEGDLEGSIVDQVVVRSDTLGDVGGRLDRWKAGWDTAMERPILGHGWGAARTLGDQDVERSLELGRVRAATNLHSTHVSLLVDVGFLGLGLFWWYAGAVVVAGLRILAAPITPETTVSTLFFASTLGMLADTLVHNGVLSAGSPTALLFWFSSALVVKQSYRLAALRREAEGASEGTRADAPPDTTAGVAVAGT